jgi:hypothetical protein
MMKNKKDEKERFEKNLTTLLKLFQGRPLHLSKYFIENNSFNQEFIDNVIESKKLDELSNKYVQGDIPTIFFLNYKEMLRFFENISNELNFDNLNSDRVGQELNTKLDELIKSEKYEEAIKIRDFMIQNNIKRNI